MLIRTIFLLFLFELFGRSDARLPEVDMTVPEIVSFYDYPIEQVEVTTQDGYILTLHRIPWGIKGKGRLRAEKKPVIFLQHGLIASSADWVLNLPSQSAGFIFADAGFDVWMGNVRGNFYSTKHVNESYTDYWNFTWDEMALYDIPAMIDGVLKITESEFLYYVGHSQGTEIMFTRLSLQDGFEKKIKKFFALAPVATVTYVKGLLSYLGDKFDGQLEKVFYWFGARQFLGHNVITDFFSVLICGSKFISPLCRNVMFQIAGPESNQWNNTRLPVYMSHTPAGTSTVNLVHWIQVHLAKKLQKYDFGSAAKNLERYGQSTPPVYNLSGITTPTYLYFSPADWLATERDVEETIIKQIDNQYLKRIKPMPEFNHFDFIYGLNAKEKIYDEIIKAVRQSFLIHS
ncbi:Lipase [Aphelenchoides besseyi]|nr:Lipase [Aphelenchoides besseyi]